MIKDLDPLAWPRVKVRLPKMKYWLHHFLSLSIYLFEKVRARERDLPTASSPPVDCNGETVSGASSRSPE